MTEEWRVVPSYPWLEASSDGRIRRCLLGKNGWPAGKIIAGSINNAGYRATIVQRGRFRKTNVCFHVLVCEAFHGLRPSENHEVAHGDGIRTNNKPWNLRWATPKQNAGDRSVHGTQQGGENHPASKLLTADVMAIRHLKEFGFRGSDIALMFDMNRNTINRISAGTIWTRQTVNGASNALLSFGC